MNTKTLAEGTFLGLYANGHWEYAARTNSTGAVGVLPITDNEEIILVEQFRIPVANRVIEIPAGIAGDEDAFSDESLADTAARELLEETGYRARQVTPLMASPTSAGMTTEMVSLFVATGLTREHEGGGTHHEDIVVHKIALNELDIWLSQQQTNGLLVDLKIHACLYLARQQGFIHS
ncbi:MAG: NUDIX hydrolase [Akkermansiaceae bacterium]